jgi:hypothetical protein
MILAGAVGFVCACGASPASSAEFVRACLETDHAASGTGTAPGGNYLLRGNDPRVACGETGTGHLMVINGSAVAIVDVQLVGGAPTPELNADALATFFSRVQSSARRAPQESAPMAPIAPGDRRVFSTRAGRYTLTVLDAAAHFVAVPSTCVDATSLTTFRYTIGAPDDTPPTTIGDSRVDYLLAPEEAHVDGPSTPPPTSVPRGADGGAP